MDVSGTTDAEGKYTRGYDPSVDIAWLQSEIEQWIKGNLVERWWEHPAADTWPSRPRPWRRSRRSCRIRKHGKVVMRALDRLGLKRAPGGVERRDHRQRGQGLHP